jgi:1-deoxy-D-xylulose-5-phosphate synthase
LTGKLDTWGDRLRHVASRLEEGIKVVITPGMLFEALGFRYFGPINGHNVNQLVGIFQQIKNYPGPILVHVNTQKGKGYKPAEADVQKLHGVTPFDKITGISPKKQEATPAYTKIFGAALVEIARQNPNVVAITAAMPDGTGVDQLQQAFPHRFFDVGIAEQHAVTFSAGLATQGCVPVVAIYSTFLQRAIDQIVHDVAIQHLHVVFVLDRAGLVGADGPTHHGTFDLTYLRMIPGMVVMAPKDESELRDMLYTATLYDKGPIALRYPRGNGLGVPLKNGFDLLPIGKGETLRSGTDVAIVAIGAMVANSLKAAELLEKQGVAAEVINMRFVKPLDTELLDALARRFTHIVTIEDNVVTGGMGSAVAEFLATSGNSGVTLKIHGIPDRFIEHGTPAELYRDLALDAPGIADIVRQFLPSGHAKQSRRPGVIVT